MREVEMQKYPTGVKNHEGNYVSGFVYKRKSQGKSGFLTQQKQARCR